ncbi:MULTISPECIES: YkvA family protein [unclassified Streptomyces]|uniref:YkvA family protein n=1 Tax=unclassified Streptomyces TaxID=2593676 RepID=UPI003D762FDA
MDTTTTVIVVTSLLAAATLAVAAGLAVRLVRTRRDLRRAGLPTGPRWVFWGAVLYLFLPTDLLPDPVYLDDIGVLLLALRSLRAPLAGRERGAGGESSDDESTFRRPATVSGPGRRTRRAHGA